MGIESYLLVSTYVLIYVFDFDSFSFQVL